MEDLGPINVNQSVTHYNVQQNACVPGCEIFLKKYFRSFFSNLSVVRVHVRKHYLKKFLVFFVCFNSFCYSMGRTVIEVFLKRNLFSFFGFNFSFILLFHVPHPDAH